MGDSYYFIVVRWLSLTILSCCKVLRWLFRFSVLERVTMVDSYYFIMSPSIAMVDSYYSVVLQRVVMVESYYFILLQRVARFYSHLG